MHSYKVNQSIPQNIFRSYDIRGIVDHGLTENNVYTVGRAFASEAIVSNHHEIVIGRDGRLSGEKLLVALSQGLRDGGCNVIDIGAQPTPVLYFATHLLKTGSGIMLTGSHNPGNYNGLKMMLSGSTLAREALQNLYGRVIKHQLHLGHGKHKTMDVLDDYIQAVLDDIQLTRSLKIVIDAGNGIAGKVAPKLYRALGCEVTELFCDVDGRFPNHHPDPSQPQNIKDLIAAVKKQQADIGLAFDGDGDRLGVVTNDGASIAADRQMMLYAMDVLGKNPEATIIFDVKCTRFLRDIIKQEGGKPLMSKTGHSLIKAKMQAESALLAGEMSGHIFFNDRWFGFDDALYAGARLLEIIALQNKTVAEIFATLPNSITTPEINVPMADDEKFAFVAALKQQADFGAADINTLDGIRVEFADGWGLLRCSNTTPNLVLRFEADNETVLRRIKALFKAQMLMVNSQLILDF